jgi:CBS domain containing-hemolysin-like protein
MTDADPTRRPEGGRSNAAKPRGLLGLLSRFRKPDPEADGDTAEPETAATGELVSHARAFQDLRLEDVMKPRADIVAVDKTCTFAEVVGRFVESEHSRMPVYKETLDDPVGVIHVKDVFKLMARKTRKPKPEDQILQGSRHIVRKMLYVPPSMPAATLLAQMRSRRTHMALVIDEFGGTDGLVTLEDLLEKLVGEIADEHDEDSDQGYDPIVEDDQGWIADGRAPLEDLEAAIGEGVELAPEDMDEEIDTVAGLVNALAGRVPQRGDRIDHPDGYVFEVTSADPRRVKRVRIRPAASAGAPAQV